MASRKDLIIAVLSTFCMAAALFAVLPTRSQSAEEYNPWADLNDDGHINAKDAIQLGLVFSTSGDPAKNVTVTNWPKSSDVVVWYEHPLADGAVAISPNQYSKGYSTLHILTFVNDLTSGETCHFYVMAPLWNANHTGYYYIHAYTHTFTYLDDVKIALSISVPSEEFYFYFDAAIGTTCTVSLSYYLTWA